LISTQELRLCKLHILTALYTCKFILRTQGTA
jgi:hypothetical protein